MQKVCGPLQLLVMRDVPTFKDTSFDALIGCDVLDQIPNLIFNLSKRIVSWGETTPKYQNSTMMNVCAETHSTNPFENYEPYVFPAIVEKRDRS